MKRMRVDFVELWLYQAVRRWPLAMATDLGKCWQMSWDMSPGQVEKFNVYGSSPGARQWAEACAM